MKTDNECTALELAYDLQKSAEQLANNADTLDLDLRSWVRSSNRIARLSESARFDASLREKVDSMAVSLRSLSADLVKEARDRQHEISLHIEGLDASASTVPEQLKSFQKPSSFSIEIEGVDFQVKLFKAEYVDANELTVLVNLQTREIHLSAIGHLVEIAERAMLGCAVAMQALRGKAYRRPPTLELTGASKYSVFPISIEGQPFAVTLLPVFHVDKRRQSPILVDLEVREVGISTLVGSIEDLAELSMQACIAASAAMRDGRGIARRIPARRPYESRSPRSHRGL